MDVLLLWWRHRDSSHLRRPRNFAIASITCVGRFPCEVPLALLTWTLGQDFEYLDQIKNSPGGSPLFGGDTGTRTLDPLLAKQVL